MNFLFRLKSCVFCLSSLLIVSCAPLKPVEFRSVSDLKVTNPVLSPQVSANVNFFNPNSVGCTIKNLSVDVSLSSIPLTTISFQNQHLPSNQEFSLPVSTSIPYSQLIKFIPLGISSLQGGKDIPLEVKGNVTVKKFLYKRTFPLEYHDVISTKDIQIK